MCHVDSAEVAEHYQPLLLHERSVLTDTEGAGWRRGAPALRVAYGPIEGGELTVAYVSDGEQNPAVGVRGGHDSVPAWNVRRRADGSEERLQQSGLVAIGADEQIVCLTQSGGGYGPPEQREPERVRQDVLEGVISPGRARSIYRVAVSADGEIDEAETARLRAAGSRG